MKSTSLSTLSTLSVLAAVALLGGCPTTVSCAAGERFEGGVCVPADAGPGPVDAPVLPDVPMDDAGPCGVCETGTPFCDTSTATPTCVECRSETDCDAPNLACVAGSCEVCDGNEDCTTVGASLCDTSTHTCVSCAVDADCGHLTATTVCDTTGVAGVCVECTVGNEAACDLNSCDPATHECTTTPRTSVRRCGACVADSECMNVDDRCVPMQFMGAAHGSFCLKQFDTGCMNPFRTATASRPSTSGAAAETYCGIDETVTTCEAVLDLLTDADCTTAEDCGAAGLNDGRCETVAGSANKCTYSCMASLECPTTATCGGAGYCGSP